MGREDIFNIVKRNTLEVLPELSSEMITIEKRLKDLGANSVDRMEIVTMTLEELKLKIPLVELGKLSNIEELVDFLHDRIN